MESPIKIQDAHPETPVRGARVLRLLEDAFLYADRAIERLIPAQFNPLAQLGGLANMSFLAALASGILLLFWYVPSVHQAWDSLAHISWLGQLMRSLHRYSSDATLFFVMLHALRMGAGGRFGGARWIAWVTGIILLGMLWFVGWLGYWLVWDVRAQSLAVGSAHVLEVLPIFTEPLSRTFLTDGGVSTGLFFMIFFFHMMLPLAMGVALWMHISRVSRARFLTSLPMSGWLFAALVVVSIVFPATSAAKAQMAVRPVIASADWWFLWPMMLTERLSGGLLIFVGLATTIVVSTIPWWMTRGTVQKAVVDTTYCNGCARCVDDCPYNAIIMVPRTDDHPRYEIQAQVDADKCVGCGICAGSCNPGGIGLPQMPVQDIRREIDRWVDRMLAQDDAPNIAFLCSGSAAADFRVDADGTCRELEGWRVKAVPCAGWVQALTLERALRRGARAILIVGCTGGDPHYREGVKWTQLRLDGEREPKLRHDKIEAERVHFLQYNRTEKHALVRKARDLAHDPTASGTTGPADPGRARQFLGGVLTAAVLAAPVYLLSDAPLWVPVDDTPQLVVSVKYRPTEVQNCRPMTDAEKARTPRHMQTTDQTICERTMPDVRLSVVVDGKELAREDYPPRGLSGDGPSIGTVHLPLAAGAHDIALRIGNSAEPDTWTDQWQGTLDFHQGKRQVILYENRDRFIFQTP